MILGKTVKMSSKHIVSYQSIIFFLYTSSGPSGVGKPYAYDVSAEIYYYFSMPFSQNFAHFYKLNISAL
jgi:hypothetical protein